MRNIYRCFLALSLAAIGITATAQQQSTRLGGSDMFGQSESTANESASSIQERRMSRTSIRNGTLDDIEQDANTKGATRLDPDGRPMREQRMERAPVRPPPPPSKFQEFLFESTAKRLPIFGAEFFAKAPAELDLYAFIAKGDKSADSALPRSRHCVTELKSAGAWPTRPGHSICVSIESATTLSGSPV